MSILYCLKRLFKGALIMGGLAGTLTGLGLLLAAHPVLLLIPLGALLLWGAWDIGGGL